MGDSPSGANGALISAQSRLPTDWVREANGTNPMAIPTIHGVPIVDIDSHYTEPRDL